MKQQPPRNDMYRPMREHNITGPGAEM